MTFLGIKDLEYVPGAAQRAICGRATDEVPLKTPRMTAMRNASHSRRGGDAEPMFWGSDGKRGSARSLMASGPESCERLSNDGRRDQQIEYRSAGEYRQRGQRRGPGALGVGTAGIAVGALEMRGLIVMMMVPMLTRRHLEVAQDECQTSIDRREHKAHGNEPAQEKHAEDGDRRPPMTSPVIHRVAHLCRRPSKHRAQA
jgi:hypothetical protein